MSPLAIAILAGLGGMFGWGLADFFAKKTIDRIGDITTLFWSQFIGIFPILFLFLLNPVVPAKIISPGSESLIFLILLGVWSGISYIPTYTAFGKGNVSILSPIFATYAVIVSIASALIFNEIIPTERKLALAVVFLGIFLVTANVQSFKNLINGKSVEENKIRGLKEISTAVVLFSIFLLGLNYLIGSEPWVFYLLVIRIFSSLSLFIYSKIKKINLKINNNSIWFYLLIIGIFDVSAFAFTSYGFSNTPYVSIVAMLGAAFSLPTIFLARIFLKEKVSLLQTVGSLIIIIGIMLVSFF